LWTGSYDTAIDVRIEGPTAIIPIYETINIDGALDGSLLFDATSSFTVDLPPGVTATSASGVLLTQTSTVPEPGTLIIFGTALAGLCVMRRWMPAGSSRRR
ncbi:MAG: PEP-CTERM sorting domain-containing protein, partial [Stellaceae bacterium]